VPLASFDDRRDVYYNEAVFAFAKEWLGLGAVARSAPVAARTGRAGAPVALDGVSYSIETKEGKLLILDDVSLKVEAGEFVCLLGPSGSGKSTILNLIAGLAKPSVGSVVEGERAIAEPGPDRAMVFQDAALFPWLNLLSNVEFPLKLQGFGARERRERAEELLRLVHLWRFRESFPHELSGGMRQRGAIARALATDPAILLMDEPFAALDAQTREILQGEVERIWSTTRKTVVFVTHNVREAVRLADRVVVMGTRPGRILHEAHVDIARPRSLNDGRVSALAKDIARRIASEVEKVAKEEADDAWMAPGDRVRHDPRRDLGRGI
jgi:NitT/TauT family transport system ATP-binding protein